MLPGGMHVIFAEGRGLINRLCLSLRDTEIKLNILQTKQCIKGVVYLQLRSGLCNAPALAAPTNNQ